jgi:hypothetical protein
MPTQHEQETMLSDGHPHLKQGLFARARPTLLNVTPITMTQGFLVNPSNPTSPTIQSVSNVILNLK